MKIVIVFILIVIIFGTQGHGGSKDEADNEKCHARLAYQVILPKHVLHVLAYKAVERGNAEESKGVVKYKFPEYKNDDEERETLEFLFGKGTYSYDKNDKTNTNRDESDRELEEALANKQYTKFVKDIFDVKNEDRLSDILLRMSNEDITNTWMDEIRCGRLGTSPELQSEIDKFDPRFDKDYKLRVELVYRGEEMEWCDKESKGKKDSKESKGSKESKNKNRGSKSKGDK